jgi:pimeloyl-ACP methyl ester carboxylesterase
VIQGSYAARRSDDTTLTGTFRQAGMSLPLVMHRGEKPAEARRPQDPKRPYPYIEREVRFVNAIAGDTLAGTLTMPRGDGPFPAVVLVTGSGAQNRNEEIFGHRPFLVLADRLTRQGIAVLRYDDRGYGKSTGNIASGTTMDFTDDALAGVAFLRGTPGIRADRIGIAGHSEGGLIAPMAAVRTTDVAFIVMLAGPGLPGDELLSLQTRRILEVMEQGETNVEEAVALQARMLAVAKSDRDSAAAGAACREILREYIDAQPDSVKRSPENTDAAVAQKVRRLLSPWFRTFLRLDPRIYLREVHCPVLALNGEKDLQVPVPENTDEVRRALREGGNPDATVVVLPGLNHLFQTAKTGAITEYPEIEETFAPAALDRISAWILERAK